MSSPALFMPKLKAILAHWESVLSAPGPTLGEEDYTGEPMDNYTYGKLMMVREIILTIKMLEEEPS